MNTYKRFLLVLLLLIGLSPSIQNASSQSAQNISVQKEQTVYVTDTGEKYHGANCGYLHSSKSPIKLTKAKASGYTPCSRCKGSNSYYPQSKSSTMFRNNTKGC